MSYPIDVTIPDAPDDPADDQPKMKQNYANIASYLAVDHVAAGAVGNGFHKQVTYNSENVPGSLTDPISVSYTNNAQSMAEAVGSASNIAQNFFKSQNGNFPLSAIKAFGYFVPTGAAGNIAPLNSFNIVNPIVATGISGNTLTITLASSTVVNSNNVVVLLNPVVPYTFNNPNLVLTPSTPVPTKVSFVILQI